MFFDQKSKKSQNLQISHIFFVIDNFWGGDYTDLMKRFTAKFPKTEDQLTEKQIRSFFSRLRKKIKTRVT